MDQDRHAPRWHNLLIGFILGEISWWLVLSRVASFPVIQRSVWSLRRGGDRVYNHFELSLPRGRFSSFRKGGWVEQ